MPKVPAAAVKAQYQLRASFFSNRLDTLGFLHLQQRVQNFATLHSASLNWSLKISFGVSTAAWDLVKAAQLEPALFFLHPNVLNAEPTLLRYYRCIALLPQKGFQRLSTCDSELIETGVKPVPTAKIQKVLQTLNQMMSFLLEAGGGVSTEKLKGSMYATAGVMIDGSWRNSIGVEGERVIRSLLLKSLLNHKEVTTITLDDNSVIDMATTTETVDQIVMKTPNVRIVGVKKPKSKGGNLMIFKSEPDIEMVDPTGKVLGGVEIKAGLDPAGALERLGAMLKSFDNILAVSPSAQTILVASCITDEVEKRIRESNIVKATFILTEITNDPTVSARFVNKIRGVLGLVDRRM